jgi:hypothetical protein
MTTLSKTTMNGLTLSATHKTAAASLGRTAGDAVTEIARHIDDINAALKQMVADATAGNPSDSNIATLNSIITSLA